ncbi:MAG: endonuclease/exonuclease/phosphatase family protein [Myxococcota bacterium]
MARSVGLWAVAGGALGLLMTGGALVRGFFHVPAPVEPVVVHCADGAPTLKAGAELTVLVWNVQYGASTKHQFFYDGGHTVGVPRADVEWTLDNIAQVVREIGPDVVLLQEVDRGSDRTHRVDEHMKLVEALQLPCHTSTPYHRSAYVPFPGHEHMGRVEMHLSVLSRYKLGSARRHQLALLDEPWWRQSFNLRRAILEVRLPVEQGPDLVLLDTHLSAFSKGDGTLPKQIAQVKALADSLHLEGLSVLLAGDFNALAPGDDPARLPAKSQPLYADEGDPLEPLYQHLTPAVERSDYDKDSSRFYTYAPYGAGQPDRMIDHVFTGGGVRVMGLKVKQDRTDISDHQPIVVRVGLPRP